MKAMSKDPSAVAKARRAEAKEEGGLIKVKLGGSGGGGGGGFKKGGFRNAFGGQGDGDRGVGVKKEEEGNEDGGVGMRAEREDGDEGESGTDEEDYYDPARPTGCWEGCGGR
jgi:hypothetical protein